MQFVLHINRYCDIGLTGQAAQGQVPTNDAAFYVELPVEQD
jgi:hypothetical protein